MSVQLYVYVSPTVDSTSYKIDIMRLNRTMFGFMLPLKSLFNVCRQLSPHNIFFLNFNGGVVAL